MIPLQFPQTQEKLLGLSDIYLPYAARTNPRSADAANIVRALAQGSGVLPEKLEPYFNEFTDLAAQFYPTASEDGLVLGGLLVSWLFFLDDSYDRDAEFAKNITAVRELMRSTLAILEGAPLPASPTALDRYTLAFARRLSTVSSEDWRRRFLSSVRDYLFQGSFEVVESWQGKEKFPDLGTYMRRRVQDSGVLPCIDLLEPLGGYALSEQTFHSHVIERMRELSTRVIAFSNDIISYENECIFRDKPNNLVRLYIHYHQVPFEQAVSEVIALINSDVHRFAWLKERLLEKAGPERAAFEHYATGMEALMRGNQDWSMTCRRYTSPTSPFPELRRKAS